MLIVGFLLLLGLETPLVFAFLPQPWQRTCGNNEIRFFNYNTASMFQRKTYIKIAKAAKDHAKTEMRRNNRNEDSEPTGGRFIYKGRGGNRPGAAKSGIDIEMSAQCDFPNVYLTYQDLFNTYDCIVEFAERYARGGNDPVPTMVFTVNRPVAATPRIADGHFTRTCPNADDIHKEVVGNATEPLACSMVTTADSASVPSEDVREIDDGSSEGE